MVKAILAVAVIVGIAGVVPARAANAAADLTSLGSIHNEPLLAERIYWTRDAYGRPIWIPGRPYYAPPLRYYRPWRRHRRWDGRYWR